MAQVVRDPHPAPEQVVGAPHVLAPPDELAHEALERRELDPLLGRAGEHRVEHLARVEQAAVQRRGDRGVEEHRVLRGDGVLVRAELRQPFVDELLQGRPGLLVGHRPREGCRAARCRGELALHPRDRLVDLRGALGTGPAGHHMASGQLLAVLGVEGPAPTDRLTVLDQDVEPAALPLVEGLHPGPPVPEPVDELRPRGEEVRRLEHVVRPEAHPGVGHGTAQVTQHPVVNRIDDAERIRSQPGEVGGETPARGPHGIRLQDVDVETRVAQPLHEVAR